MVKENRKRPEFHPDVFLMKVSGAVAVFRRLDGEGILINRCVDLWQIMEDICFIRKTMLRDAQKDTVVKTGNKIRHYSRISFTIFRIVLFFCAIPVSDPKILV